MSEEQLQAEVAALDTDVAEALRWAAWSVENDVHARPLFPVERQALFRQGCRSTIADWSNVKIQVASVSSTTAAATDVSSLLAQHVSHTTFGPHVVLVVPPLPAETDDSLAGVINSATATPSSEKRAEPSTLPPDIQVHPAGCHRNGYVANVVLYLATTRCCGNGVVQHTLLLPDTALIGCGHVTCDRENGVSYALNLMVGPESGGGRPLELPPHATMATVTEQLVACASLTTNKTDDSHPSVSMGSSSTKTTKPSIARYNVLFPGSFIRHTPTIHSVILHGQACIVASTEVQRTTLFPQACIANGCSVRDCRLQWKARILDNSTLTSVFLMECAAAGPSSTAAHAVLGPDVHISAGECHASVLGPNTNAHHQSLCIGLLWPMGRGNIGYGANVGSNHTGRLPDQEVVAAEGCFWGLGCVVVMPVNLGHAPYTVVAAGTTLAPGTRLSWPFSLITKENHVVPGWVFAKSAYTVVRSAHKFAQRRKAIRHAYYTGWDILRPSVVELCVQARLELQQLQQAGKVTRLTGALQCSDKARALGIETYTDLIQRYALQELLSICLEQAQKSAGYNWVPAVLQTVQQANDLASPLAGVGSTTDWTPFPWNAVPADAAATYRRVLLRREFPLHNAPRAHWLRQNLQRLLLLEQNFAKAVARSKARDDERGQATIPGYAAAHVVADEDPVVKRQQAEAATTCRNIEALLLRIPVSTL